MRLVTDWISSLTGGLRPQTPPTGSDYSAGFYAGKREGARRSAQVVWPLVRRLLEPLPVRSLVDVGCGDGTWLLAAREVLGLEDMLGVDGAYVRESHALQLPAGQFLALDLQADPLALRRHVSRTFDLCMSLEVGEHLSPERAAPFVEALVSLAPLVLFSAAVPFQGGEHHVNEAWQDTWSEHFSRHGYRAVDELRLRLWNRPEVEFWYRQNLVLYASPQALAERPTLAALAETTAQRGGVLNLVHPELFLREAHTAASLKRSRAVRVAQRLRRLVRR